MTFRKDPEGKEIKYCGKSADFQNKRVPDGCSEGRLTRRYTSASSLTVGLDPDRDASCAFLTPIGHQSNTLVMGPGGYKFGDYWRMGLVLEVIVAVVAVPLILVFWPL